MGIPRAPTVSSKVINFSNTGDNTVIAGVTGTKINVYGIFYTVAGATNVTFKDGTTALSGAYVLTANGSSQTLHLFDEPYFACSDGKDFIMNQSGAVAITGTVYFTQVSAGDKPAA